MKHLRVKINNLEFKWESVLRDIEFVLNEKDRISIVWWNWVWKTTLLKVLTWEIKNYDWRIDNIWGLKIWYLSQIYSDNEEKTVREELKDAFTTINILEEEIADIEIKMSENPENMDIIEDYNTKIEQFNNIWGYNYNNQIHQVASWMWVFDLLEKKLTQISWWQRTKVALAKILLESPDLLMLDEPTNFIDLKSVEWLEKYLKDKWKWGYFIISHDRAFLDKTCDKTFEVAPQRQLNFYHTNYSNYLIERQKREKKVLDDIERQQEFIKKEQALINRFRSWSRASFAKSREKALEKIEIIEKPYIPAKPKFFFDRWEEPSKKIFFFKEAFIWREEPLFFINEISMVLWQKVWIIWENWAWKSTLLKTILWKLDLLDWKYERWKWLKIAYYSQMHEELFEDLTIRENFEKHWLSYPEQQLVWLLKQYLFEREDIEKTVKSLSWWQRSKLLFAILWQKESNILIMDEPTNHLDYDSREELEKSIRSYKWSVIFISHDRYFINKIASHLWIIKDSELSLCYWNYEDYEYKLERWIDFDASLFDEEAHLNIALEDKLWEKEAKRIRNKYWKGKK